MLTIKTFKTIKTVITFRTLTTFITFDNMGKMKKAATKIYNNGELEMESISKERLEWLLVRMLGELKLSKPGMTIYLQALEDAEVLSKNDIEMFQNYINSHLSRLDIAQVLAPKNRKEETVENIREVWRRDKKTTGHKKIYEE